MWLEILLIALLYPLLELILLTVFDKIEIRRKWKPFEREYETAIQNGSNTNFCMIPHPENKKVMLVGVVGFFLMWGIGVICAILLYVRNEINFLEAILLNSIFSIACLPFTILFLHHFTRVIYIQDKSIFLKTIFIKKRIDIIDIVQVAEKKYQNPNATQIIIKSSKRTLRIKNHYSNYDRCKQFLIKASI